MDNKKKFKPNQDHKLMDQVREVLRYYHYAYRTEQTYCKWIKRYLGFFGMHRHPNTMGAAEVERYLSHLAEQKGVAASTQRQALNAIVECDAGNAPLDGATDVWMRVAANGVHPPADTGCGLRPRACFHTGR